MRNQSITAVLALLAATPATAASYATLADLTLVAPVIARATISKTERIPEKDSPGLAAGNTRLLVTAEVSAAIASTAPVPASLAWLWDAPPDPRGKPPKAKGQTVLVFAAAPGPDGKTRLVSAHAQLPWTAADEAMVRAIAAEARSGTVPTITGVSDGFRSEGNIAGESESQFFLTTADGKGVTLVVTAKPGEARRVAVSQGDVIDESARPVRQGTLLWYRLACVLPARPPAKIAADAPLAADYAAARASLGPCER